jgi:hypothetical protein
MVNLIKYPPKFYSLYSDKGYQLRLLIRPDGRRYKIFVKKGRYYDEVYGNPNVRPEKEMIWLAKALDSGRLVLTDDGLFEREEMIENLIRICYICGKIMGEKEPYEDRSYTHGLCEECLKKELEKIEKMREEGIIK